MVEYDARARTLSFGKNDEALRKGFENVGREGDDLFPFVMFDRRTSCRVRKEWVWAICKAAKL